MCSIMVFLVKCLIWTPGLLRLVSMLILCLSWRVTECICVVCVVRRSGLLREKPSWIMLMLVVSMFLSMLGGLAVGFRAVTTWAWWVMAWALTG